jgi:hypothetical protein
VVSGLNKFKCLRIFSYIFFRVLHPVFYSKINEPKSLAYHDLKEIKVILSFDGCAGGPKCKIY